MIQTLSRFAKDAVLNVLTVIPAFAVAVAFEMQYGEKDTTAYMLGWVLGIFFVVLVIQAIFMVVLRNRRQWVNSLATILGMLLMGALVLTIAFDQEINSEYSNNQLSFILNLGTEFLGAAVIVFLFQLRRVGVVITLAAGTYVLGLITTASGQHLDLYTNLSAEIFGSLITAWVIYRLIDLRDSSKLKQKPKYEE